MLQIAGANSAQLDVLRAEWQGVQSPESWDEAFARLSEEWRAVDWQSGGKTLLAALGIQYLEVPLCRGLAWMLDPAGGHRLGRHMVDAFLTDLGLPVVADAAVTITVEEIRADTRADIVIRIGEQTVLVEAKVLAGEQPQQADRLSAHWANENPLLVFLTRSGQLPHTAQASSGRWLPRTWRDVARIARAAIVDASLEPSAGAREFIETIGAI